MSAFSFYECWVCGIPFGLTEGFVDAATRQHKTFFCPNGCRLAFGPSKADVLEKEKRELELRMQAQINSANHARLVAEKLAKKAIKQKRDVERRIAHGICPCCNQVFSDVSHHMLTEHKEYRLPEGKKPKQIEGPVN